MMADLNETSQQTRNRITLRATAVFAPTSQPAITVTGEAMQSKKWAAEPKFIWAFVVFTSSFTRTIDLLLELLFSFYFT